LPSGKKIQTRKSSPQDLLVWLGGRSRQTELPVGWRGRFGRLVIFRSLHTINAGRTKKFLYRVPIRYRRFPPDEPGVPIVPILSDGVLIS
jgi:hypothetical protein